MDSTRVKELEATVEDLQRRLIDSYQMASLGRLIAGIIHEINTPIGSIVSNNEVMVRTLTSLRGRLSELAAAGQPPTPKALQILETLSSLADVDKIACDRILGVIRGLKTFARPDSEELRHADLNDLIASMAKLSDCEYRRRVKLVTALEPLPEIECYPQQLTQVMLNLLVNASQAIETEGTVTVRSRQDDGQVEVTVSDTGKGIAPEHRKRIFEQGFTTKALGVGTGLGLALSKRIVVDQHHGTIDFDSELGRGTTFRIRLPIQQPKQQQ